MDDVALMKADLAKALRIIDILKVRDEITLHYLTDKKSWKIQIAILNL
jgi:hypothetical protein